jgi:hypothetical protein
MNVDLLMNDPQVHTHVKWYFEKMEAVSSKIIKSASNVRFSIK